MCGILGVWGESEEELIVRMSSAIDHRGPDGHGIERFGPDSFTSAPPVSLGHRRLSIIDLSDAGLQPMCNEDGKVWLTFNGEIYNFKDLRKQLVDAGHQFRSKTDSEVLVHAYEEWGIGFVERLNGIFAFAIWDRSKGELHLARDRLGVKPLYYGRIGNRLLFASEIKALLQDAELVREIDENALLAMSNYRYCPEPLTLFKSVRKLRPGHVLSIRSDGSEAEREFYSVSFEEPTEDDDVALCSSELLEKLREATSGQLMADVEVGLFLSGGVDSSALLALADSERAEALKTFTIGFRQEDQHGEGQPDDIGYARQVAKQFGTDHREIILDPKVVDSLQQVVWHLDEPTADPAAIASFLICGAAREQGIKVLLSGQGGDEVFCGYPWHAGAHIAQQYRRAPAVVRRLLESVVRRLPASGGGRFAGSFRRARKFTASASKNFEDSLLGFLSYSTGDELRALLGERFAPATAAGWPHYAHRKALEESRSLHHINRLLHLDLQTFLPSLNLAYTDKMSMANGVEVRVPLIDNVVVDYMGKRSPSLKIRNGTRKFLLKKCLEDLLPHDVLYRKKGGFGAPIRGWVKRDLREMIGDLLAPSRVKDRGFFDPGTVTRIIEANQSGREDRAYLIYFLLSFEIWSQRFLDR